MNGIAIVSSLKDLIRSETPTIYLLPSRLRLIRTTSGDNGFSGIRTVTAQSVFMQELAQEAQTNKETPDYLPDDIEGIAESPSSEHPGQAFSGIKEGEFMTVTVQHRLKYLVCNPNHRWAIVVHEGIALLCPCSPTAAKKAFKAFNPIEVNIIASFV